jgi:hypothetical protein
MEIAKEILRQLGGSKFVVMTGSKNFVSDNNKLTMQLTTNALKAKWLTITLDASDTYTMKFLKLKGSELTTLKEIEGVYCDQLQTLFTKYTGLYTSL